MGEPPSIAEFCAALGRVAPPGKAAGWDSVGLQLGDPARPARRVALCHEVTEAVASRACGDPPDLLVSYHPLLFRPTAVLVAGATPAGRALRLIGAGVAVAAVHTNFDVVPGGAADALADALGLAHRSSFAPLDGAASVKIATFLPAANADDVLSAVAGAGAGVIGNYTHCSFRTDGTGTFFGREGTSPVVGAAGALHREPEVRLEFVAPRAREAEVLHALVSAHPYEEPAYDVVDRRGDAGAVGRLGDLDRPCSLDALAGHVREVLSANTLRRAGAPDRSVRRVAVVPGAGADFLAQAAALGADAMVTGDVSHHRAREALDRGLALVDPGHAATERPGLRRLAERIEPLAPTVEFWDELDPDPWR